MEPVKRAGPGRTAVSMVEVAARAGVSVGTVSNVLNHPHKVRPVTIEKVRAAIQELGHRDGATSTPARTNPSMVEVAARAGVSVGTVSNVLNHPQQVRPATLEKVRAVIEELGFTPNANARSLAGADNRTIGLVVVDLQNTLFVDIARGAQREAAAQRMSLLVTNSDRDDAQQDAHLDLFESARVRGVLLAPLSDPDAGVQRVRRHGTPVVVLNYDSGRRDCCTVLVDNEQVGYLAARHMIDLGRRRLAWVSELGDLQPVQHRSVGVRRALREAGRGVSLTEVDTQHVHGSHARHAVEQILALPARRRPDAVVAVTDLLAAAVVEELQAAGVAVPGDVAVMGCDHDARAWGGAVPLTTVRMEGEQMGAAAVRLLAAEVAEAGEHTHRTVVVQPSLLVRESSAGRPVPPGAVSAAGSARPPTSMAEDVAHPDRESA
ncbi:LacI family DNA-binding transcriptional regulator [Kineococcus sp. SYSU DK005]|uniref:LacI family DNA-binding transcriptional regulator n=1 Tax=Kineococcus sp. SYSU DK005 TaxID=3383126 RepID=UPI003D7E336E